VLTRHSALLQFNFLIEQPHSILASLVNQVLLKSSFTDEEESLVVAMIVMQAKCCGPHCRMSMCDHWFSSWASIEPKKYLH
jgi:hypothetical protein